MKVSAIKTPLVKVGDDIQNIIHKSIKALPEKSILVITSKVFSFCENRLVKKKSGTREEKHELAKKEAEYYLDPHSSKYNLMLTIKGNWMFVNAGIDESNSDNQYSLWPKNPQKSVNSVWRFLRRHYHLNKVGVIMSDSRSFPLNWGVVGHGIVHCGFAALKSYVGRPMSMEGASGKNPVYHIGKLYNIAALETARKLHAITKAYTEVFLVSQSGRDLLHPWKVVVKIANAKFDTKYVKNVVEKEIENISKITNKLLQAKIRVA